VVSQKERAFATGVLNAGTNAGAIIAPLIVPFIALAYGWRELFSSWAPPD
jgi:ACS family hexuronate transporter-like MFS transporter